MAITSLSSLITGLRPTVFSQKNGTANVSASPSQAWLTPWYATGYPNAGSVPSSGMAGAALTSSPGALPFENAAAGASNYIARLARVNNAWPFSGNLSFYMIMDRLWEQSGIDRTLTTAQTINSVAWPARDNNGSTNGDGVYLALEVSTAMGAGTPTITVSYTNSAGTSGRSGTGIFPTVAARPQGSWIPIGLQAGDIGVRSVQSITFSATWGTSGVLHLVAYRPICILANGRLGMITSQEDAVTLGMPQVWNNSVLMPVAWLGGVGSSTGYGLQVTYAQG